MTVSKRKFHNILARISNSLVWLFDFRVTQLYSPIYVYIAHHQPETSVSLHVCVWWGWLAYLVMRPFQRQPQVTISHACTVLSQCHVSKSFVYMYTTLSIHVRSPPVGLSNTPYHCEAWLQCIPVLCSSPQNTPCDVQFSDASHA